MNKGVCKHYSCGAGLKVQCAAGVDVRKLVGGPNWGWRRRIPCNVARMAGTSLEAIDPVRCDLYEEPTEQEIRESEERDRRGIEAMLAVVERGEVGTPCPECGEPMGPSGCPKGCVWWRACRHAGGP